MYKVKNNLAPTDVAELFNLNNSSYSRRNKYFHLSTRFNTVTYGKHWFRYFGPLLWKRLNNKVEQSPSLQSFKNAIGNLDISGVLLFYFINFAPLPPPKKKQQQTNKKTERTFSGTPQQLWPITVGPDTNEKIKTRNIKKYSDSRKTTATYNQLLDETRDEHCYILNR